MHPRPDDSSAAPVPQPGGSGWRQAVVESVDHPSARAVRLRLAVPDRMAHLPGQHYVVRLTAEDGYTAARSYSIASPPSDPLVELYVERLADGEVSGFLAEVVEPGDTLEVRGPIGGWFVWDGGSPAIAVGGGSGVVPLVAMLRHAVGLGVAHRLRLAVSARTLDDLPYAGELMATGALIALTRAGLGTRPAGRLTDDEIAALVDPAATAYVCGSAGFAEGISTRLVAAGMPAAAVRVERFGPSSG